VPNPVGAEKLYADSAQSGVMWPFYAQPWVLDAVASFGFYTDVTGTYYAYLVDSNDTIISRSACNAIDASGNFWCMLAIVQEGRVKISAADLQVGETVTSYLAVSEPIRFANNLVKVEYWNNDNNAYAWFWNNLQTLLYKMSFWIPAAYIVDREQIGSESYTNSQGEDIDILTGTAEVITINTGLIPAYLHSAIRIALQHHNIEIGGIPVRRLEYEKEEIEDYALTAGAGRVQVIGSYKEVLI
jgi:hypothetical protein